MKARKPIQQPCDSVLYDMILNERGIPCRTKYVDCEIIRVLTWYRNRMPAYEDVLAMEMSTTTFNDRFNGRWL